MPNHNSGNRVTSLGIVPSELRWTKSDSGSSVTWSYTDTNNPTAFSAAQIKAEQQQIMDKISAVCSVNLVEVVGSADIEFIWDTVGGDGSGGTIAYVYQPSSGNNMAACGICGDVFFDVADDPPTLTDFFNVTLHETMHSLGIGHITGQISIMNSFYAIGSPEFQVDSWTAVELTKRYPNNF